jgi:hypothetical protein
MLLFSTLVIYLKRERSVRTRSTRSETRSNTLTRSLKGAEECVADHARAGAARWLRVRVTSATWTTLIVSGLAVVAAGGLGARTQTGTRPFQSLATSRLSRRRRVIPSTSTIRFGGVGRDERPPRSQNPDRMSGLGRGFESRRPLPRSSTRPAHIAGSVLRLTTGCGVVLCGLGGVRSVRSQLVGLTTSSLSAPGPRCGSSTAKSCHWSGRPLSA